MLRKSFVLCAVIALAGTLLIGCAQPTPAAAPTQAPKSATAATAAPTAVAPATAAKKITWATWGGAAQEELYKQAIAKFEASQPDIKVELINIADFTTMTTKVQTMVAGGTPPDVIMMGGEWIPVFAAKGVFADLTSYIEKDKSFKVDDYFPNLIEAMKYNGKIYALPKDFNVNALYYNKDAFDKAGIKYPTRDWTWDDLLSAAQKLTEKDASGRVTRYGLYAGGTPVLWVWQNGGEYFDRNQEPTKVRLTEAPAVQALQWYYDLSLKYKVSPTDAVLSQGGGRQEFFAAGRLAMLVDHRGASVVFTKIKDFKWELAELPQGKTRASTLNTAGFAVAAASKNGDAAWQFAQWLSGKGGMSIFVAGGNSLPGIKGLAEDPSMNVQKVFLDTVPYSRPYFSSSKWAELNQVLTTATQEMAIGTKTAEQGAKEIKEKGEAVLK
jgi:multiple sugar transport system substrate-binding protein